MLVTASLNKMQINKSQNLLPNSLNSIIVNGGCWHAVSSTSLNSELTKFLSPHRKVSMENTGTAPNRTVVGTAQLS